MITLLSYFKPEYLDYAAQNQTADSIILGLYYLKTSQELEKNPSQEESAQLKEIKKKVSIEEVLKITKHDKELAIAANDPNFTFDKLYLTLLESPRMSLLLSPESEFEILKQAILDRIVTISNIHAGIECVKNQISKSLQNYEEIANESLLRANRIKLTTQIELLVYNRFTKENNIDTN